MIEKVEKAVQERWVPSFKYERNEPGAKKPIEEAKGVIITTDGIYVKGQSPFQDHYGLGDPSYREIRHDVDFDQLSIAHEHYDHTKANEDRNVVFPLEIMKHLSEEGTIGSYRRCSLLVHGLCANSSPIEKGNSERGRRKIAASASRFRHPRSFVTDMSTDGRSDRQNDRGI